MSLINAVRRPDRVFMVSDGAGLDDDDTDLAAIGSKELSIPYANAVIGCRGNQLISIVANGIAADCAKFPGLDGLKSYLVGAVRATFDAGAASWVTPEFTVP